MSAPRRRVPRRAVVVGREALTRDLVRVHFELSEPIEPPVHTDAYVKLLFDPTAPEGEPRPLVVEGDELPEDVRPALRTYTIRSLVGSRMSIDFVVHGDAGLAGPWAATAEKGDRLWFLGPGAGWAPDPGAAHHLLVGDESAAPAIAAALDALPHDARATVFCEVADASTHVPLRTLPGLDVRWIHRDESDAGRGVDLARAVREFGVPDGDVFVHGNADTVKDLRRFLFVEQQVPRERVSISGYWRPGQDENAWQAGKREFVAEMEAEEARAWADSQGGGIAAGR